MDQVNLKKIHIIVIIAIGVWIAKEAVIGIQEGISQRIESRD